MWGAPRAELIALQCARATHPDDARLARREAELLADDWSGEILLGELRPHVEGSASPSLALVWRYGFVRSATVTPLDDDSDEAAPEDVVTMLLSHPSGRLVESIALVGLSPEAARRAEAASRRQRGRRLRITAQISR